LGPGGHFFREVLNLRVSKIARGLKSASAGNSRVFCRERLLQEGICKGLEGGHLLVICRGFDEGKMSSAGGVRRARCHLQGSGWFSCRTADVKHLSARSLPGTPVGRAVVLMVIIIR